MTKIRLVFITLTILIASNQLAYLSNVFAQSPKSLNVGIEAFIEAKGSIKLFGFTGPFSKVIAEGPRSYAQTISEKNGYFSFDSIQIAEETKEICVYSVDYQKRTTYPNCIPLTESNSNIGPVLLPPTISITDNLSTREQLSTSGQTIPESTVEIIIADGSQKTQTTLISKAYAFILPKYTVKSDQNGNYSFNIPEKYGDYRVFSLSDSKEGFTPKSQTLTIQVADRWNIVILILLLIFLLIFAILILKKRKSNIYIDDIYKLKVLSARTFFQKTNIHSLWKSL